MAGESNSNQASFIVCWCWDRLGASLGLISISPHRPLPSICFVCRALCGRKWLSLLFIEWSKEIIGEESQFLLEYSAGGMCDCPPACPPNCSPSAVCVHEGGNNSMSRLHSETQIQKQALGPYLLCSHAMDRDNLVPCACPLSSSWLSPAASFWYHMEQNQWFQ